MSNIIVLNQRMEEVLNVQSDSIPRVGDKISVRREKFITTYVVNSVEYQFDMVTRQKCICIKTSEFSKVPC